MAKTAVLIPCFNEEQTVEKVVRDFRTELPEADIYVYDNNSTDRTAELAEKAGAIVRKEPLQGKGNVVRSMFRDIDADVYLMVDGDDTYPAEAAAEMIAPVLNQNIDMVIGDRLTNGTYFKENKRRLNSLGNSMTRKLINFLFHGHVTDIMTGYRAFSRKFAKCMPVMSTGFEIETEMTVFSLVYRMRIESIPIEYRDRPEGSFSKLHTFRDGFRALVTLFDLFKNYRPFYFFFIISMILLVIGLCVGIPASNIIAQGSLNGIPSLIACAILIISSVLLLISGIILDAIKNQTIRQFEEYMNTYIQNEHRK